MSATSPPDWPLGPIWCRVWSTGCSHATRTRPRAKGCSGSSTPSGATCGSCRPILPRAPICTASPTPSPIGPQPFAGLRLSLMAYAYFLEHEGRLEEALEVLALAVRTHGPEVPAGDFAASALFAGRLNRLLARWNEATSLLHVGGVGGRAGGRSGARAARPARHGARCSAARATCRSRGPSWRWSSRPPGGPACVTWRPWRSCDLGVGVRDRGPPRRGGPGELPSLPHHR